MSRLYRVHNGDFKDKMERYGADQGFKKIQPASQPASQPFNKTRLKGDFEGSAEDVAEMNKVVVY